MKKVSPCTPFKNFLTKKVKGIEDTDRHKGIAYLLFLCFLHTNNFLSE